MGSSGGEVRLGGAGSAADDFLAVAQSGKNFSGRERHCFYLNDGEGKFANASALSGLDLRDDGRGVAVSDWDQDGDLDLWISNRSGPQLRFLQNRLGNDSSATLALRLRGTRCNRDAIGARVELEHDSEGARQSRSLRAGDGFLSQSSKWIHFGAAGESSAVTVAWPGGASERFAIDAPGRYELIEGSGLAQKLPARPAVRIGTVGATPPTADTLQRILTNTPLALPQLDGVTTSNPGSFLLINLFSSSCEPCVRELEEFARNEQVLRAAGVDVIALSTDNLGSAPRPHGAATLLKIGFPFATVPATQQTLEILQAANNTILDVYEPLPLPSSFLLDHNGDLAAIYKGQLPVETLLADLRSAGLEGDARRAAAVPFAGRWIAPRRLMHFADFNKRLAAIDAAISADYFAAHRQMMESHPDAHSLQASIGAALVRENADARALDFLNAAIARQPRTLEALVALAQIRSSSADPSLRKSEEALDLAEAAVALSARNDPRALDALAAANAESGFFFAAKKVAKEALELALAGADESLAKEIQERLSLYEAGVPFRR